MRKINLIPLAGNGQRFIDGGYSTPKPLIDINGYPMIVRAANSLPEADKWIFICKQSHLNDYKIDVSILKYFPGATIIPVNELTEGQAVTCLLAKDYLLPSDILTIGACDNGMIYNESKLEPKIVNNDAIIWTFKNNPLVVKNPKMYGWVSIEESSTVNGVSCKSPLSGDPINDHAVVGTFTFKRAEYFLNSVEEVISKNRRVNGEFYLDVVLDECVHQGYNVSIFQVDDYICWGTPDELEKYLSK